MPQGFALRQLLTSVAVVAVMVASHSAAASGKPRSPADQTATVDSVVRATIDSKCHLTTYQDPPVVTGTMVELTVAFDNASLRGFWAPDVAVQYGFDAAVRPLVRALFSDKAKRFKNINIIRITLDIAPHDIPPTLVFEISRAAWEAYHHDTGGISKVDFYKRIKITAGDKPFAFDPERAADIE